MCDGTNISWPHMLDEPGTHPEFAKQAQMILDYACVLEEKAELEKKASVLECANGDLVSRLQEAEKNLDEDRQLLQLNEELVNNLRKQLDKSKQELLATREANKNFTKGHNAIITDLREDLRVLRKKLCVTTAELDKSNAQLSYMKERCVEYKDKLRGFAILFTYFNDPKRERSKQLLTTSESSVSRSQNSSAGLTTTSNVASLKRETSEQGVQHVTTEELGQLGALFMPEAFVRKSVE